MRGNYEWKLLQKVNGGNYYRKLSASILCRGKMWELQGYWRIQKVTDPNL